MLDPHRYPRLYLADLTHTLPMPGTARFFDKAGEIVDLHDPFWQLLVADGSLVREPAKPKVLPPAAAVPAPVPSAAPVPDRPESKVGAPDPAPTGIEAAEQAADTLRRATSA